MQIRTRRAGKITKVVAERAAAAFHHIRRCSEWRLQERAEMADETDASPLAEAQARLSSLAAAGMSPARITGEVGRLIAGWASEMDMTSSTVQARIEQLWDGFTRDAAALQEQISDADGSATHELDLARQQLAALRAVVAALEAAHERLPS